MSNTVDKRVVEMQFDNEQFESGIQTSVKSLDKLKQSLRLEDSAKELTSLQKAGRSFNLDSLVEAAETVTNRFSTMGIIGQNVLGKITNAAFNAMNQMRQFISSFTTEPIRTGFAEYETQINAIQTILANTSDAMNKLGYDQQQRLDIVNEKLDELNRYADKTIYNFTEMTRNIGTFTAAGVELNTAVASIQGIANLAAVSGSTSEQASRAMYQMSQAISTGTMKLMDWNSVVNAGMGGEVFQKALLRTARAMGVTGEKAQEAYHAVVAGNMSFRDSLSSGWLTSDILTATLEQISWDFETLARSMGMTVNEVKELKKADLLTSGYTIEEADAILALAETATDAATKVKTFSQLLDTLKEAAQSGWTQTWEYIVGDFEEAKAFLTEISKYFGKIIDSSADARNAIVKEWKDLGGRSELIESFWNILHGIQNIVGTARSEFQAIFPPATGKQMLTITQRFNGMTASFKAFTENASNMEVLRKAVRGVASVLNIVKSALTLAGRGFMNILRLAGAFFGVILRAAGSVADYLQNVRRSVEESETFRKIVVKLGEAGAAFRDVFTRAISHISGAFQELGNRIGNSKVLSDIGDELMYFVRLIPGAIDGLTEWIGTMEITIRNSEKLQKVWSGIRSFFGTLVNLIKDVAVHFRDAIYAFTHADVSAKNGLFEKIKERLKAFAQAFSGWFPSVEKVVIGAWNLIKNLFLNLFDTVIPRFFSSTTFSGERLSARLRQVDWGKIIKTVLGTVLLGQAISLLRNLISLKKVISSIGETIGQVGSAIKGISENGLKITKSKKDSIGNTLLKIAISIGVLVGSIYLLSRMREADIAKGLGVITLLSTELLIISALFSKFSGKTKGFFMMAASILILVAAVKQFENLNFGRALTGIIALGAILTELTIFMKKTGNIDFKNQASLVGIGIGINLIVIAMKQLASIKVGDMLKSLVGIEVILLEMTAFMKKTSGTKQIAGLIGMAVAINLLVIAVKNLGKLKTSELVKGVLGLAGVMTAFAVMTKMINSGAGMNIGNSLILLGTLAAALLLFVGFFKIVEDMNADAILKFSTSISETILALSVAMKIMSTVPVSGAIRGIAGFSVFIVGIGGLITALGWLKTKWQGMDDFLTRGGDVLGKIGFALGNFIGSIGAGFVSGLDLPALGNDLSLFMSNAKGFIEGIKNVDGSVATNTGYLATALVNIGGAEFKNALVTLFTGENPVTKFSKDLVLLGEGLMDYAKSIRGFEKEGNPRDIQASVDSAKGLSEAIANLSAKGGLLQRFLGEVSLESFAADILKLADGLKAYATSVHGFSDVTRAEDLDKSIQIAKALSDLNNSLPSTGGKLQKWIGESSLSSFAIQLENLAKGLMAYAKTISGFVGLATQDDLNSASEVAQSLSDLNNSLPGTGGVLQEWIGSKDLGIFADKIVVLAGGLISYATTIKGFSEIAAEDDLNMAASVAEGLSKLNNSLPPTGGKLHEWIFGEQNLELFSKNIVTLGNGLHDFADSVKDMDSVQSASAVNILDMLNIFITGLEGSGSLWDALDVVLGDGDKILTLLRYTNVMRRVGDDLKSFSESMENVGIEKVSAAQNVIEAIQAFLGGLETQGSLWQWFGDTFGSGSSFDALERICATIANIGTSFKTFSAGTETIEQDIARLDMVQTMLESLKNLTAFVDQAGSFNLLSVQNLLNSFSDLVIPEFDTKGLEVANSFLGRLSDGLQNGEDSLTVVVIALSQSCVDAVNGTYETWFAAGQYLGSGIGNGIAAMAGVVNQQAISMAAGAIHSVSVTWQVHSPSRVGTNLGMQFDQGVAIGFASYTGVVNQAAEDMSQSAVDSARTLLRGANQSLFDNLDPNPTIRPVLDLEGVRRGVDSIGEMFSSNPMVRGGVFRGANFSRNVNALNFDGSKILGGLNNKDVVSEIKTLSDRFDSLADAVANMKLVLDSGELVGRTSAKMDSQLGTLAMRKGRGN